MPPAAAEGGGGEGVLLPAPPRLSAPTALDAVRFPRPYQRS